MLFGVYPALQSTKRDVAGMSARVAADTATRRQARIRGGLVVVEVALSVILLLGAGVLVRNFATLLKIDLGFDTSYDARPCELCAGVVPDSRSRLRFYPAVLDRFGRCPASRR